MIKHLTIDLKAIEASRGKCHCPGCTTEWSLKAVKAHGIADWIGAKYAKDLNTILEYLPDTSILDLLSEDKATFLRNINKHRAEANKIKDSYMLAIIFKNTMPNFLAKTFDVGIGKVCAIDKRLVKDQIESMIPNWHRFISIDPTPSGYSVFYNMPKSDFEDFKKILFAWIGYEELEEHFECVAIHPMNDLEAKHILFHPNAEREKELNGIVSEVESEPEPKLMNIIKEFLNFLNRD